MLLLLWDNRGCRPRNIFILILFTLRVFARTLLRGCRRRNIFILMLTTPTLCIEFDMKYVTEIKVIEDPSFESGRRRSNNLILAKSGSQTYSQESKVKHTY